MVGSTKILIVEDDDRMLALLDVMLEMRGYVSVHAKNFEDAIKAVKRHNFAYVIADIFMSGMGGIEGIRQLKRLDPFIPVMAVSGGWDEITGERTVEAAQAVGADAALAKPFSEDSFEIAFERLKSSGIT
ncbi:MAG: response regulator [Rhodospirillales bacterium]